MAMIFQEPTTALNPVMRCGEQIDEVLRRHTALDAAARRAKVLEGLADVRLPDPARMASSYPHQLSGGQRQRIMIAMALVLDPKLLIADEPTTALDVTTQAQILALIRDLMREHGTGVLFITHDFGVVAEIADRVAVLKRGELVELGTGRRGAARAEARLHQDADRGGAEHDAAASKCRHDFALVEAKGLSKTYVPGRLGSRAVATCERPTDVALEIRPRRDARHRRRIRVGQVDGGALHRAAGRPDVGSVKIDGLEVATLPRGACARCAARSDRVPGSRTAR
jgi:peptide/nickel transport system ATP-binding protein